MASPQNNKFASTQKISQMLRATTLDKIDIVNEVKKDMKQSIFENSRNDFNFYDVKTEVTLPRKRLPQNFPQSYKSVSRINDSKSQKQLDETFKENQYTHLEKAAISEIRQEHGRNVLLSDVYTELSKENDTTPKSQRAVSMKAAKEFSKASASKEVEDLDKWTQLKIHNIKAKHHSEVEELKKEVNRMMFFMEEAGVTMSDRKAVDSILDEIDESQKKNPFTGFGSPKSEEKSWGDTGKGFMRSQTLKSLNTLPKIQNKMKEESVDYMSQGSISLVDSFYGANSKLPLKQRLSHYKSIHDPIELKLARQIEGIEMELERRKQIIGKLSDQSEKLSRRADQLVEQIDTLSNKMDKLYGKKDDDDDEDEELYWAHMPPAMAKEEMKKRAEKEKKEREMLKNYKEELGKCRRLLEVNEPELARNESECSALKKKMSVFLRIKIKLYLKILKQGLDSRDEGLVWVLKDLMKEGENITYDDFPAFLDNASRAHLMQKTRQLNHLTDLKSTERSLINNFRVFSEGNIYNVNASTIGFHQKQKALADSMVNMSHLKSPRAKDRKVRTLNEVDTFQSYVSRLDSTISLNELDLDAEDQEMQSIEIFDRPGKKKITPIHDQKLKAISLAFIPEDKAEEIESPSYPKTTKRNNTTHFSKLMSLNDLKTSKNNLNETLYQETKSVLGQVCRDKNRSQTQLNKTRTEEFNVPNENSNLNSTKTQNKAEMLTKIHSVQSEVSLTLQKIHEDDQKEGLRIIKEHDPKRSRMDLEFYLACVLGTALADKFFKRFALKPQNQSQVDWM